MIESNPILRNFRGRIGYAAGWIALSMVQAIAIFFGGCPVPFGWALMDAAVFNLLFSIVAIPLWFPVRFHSRDHRSGYANLLLPYLLLGGVVIAGWSITGNWMMRGVASNPQYLLFLSASSGWRIIEGILYYVVAIIFYSQYVQISRLSEKMAVLEQEAERQNHLLTRIAVKERQQIHIILMQEISYLEALGDYVQIHTTKGVFLKEQTMKYFEEHLPPEFVRIHRSVIVHIDHVHKIELYEKETYRVWLKDGTTLKASSNGYKRLKEVVKL